MRLNRLSRYTVVDGRTPIRKLKFVDFDLVVTDMDGTLLNPDHTIPEQFWPLLAELRARGLVFAPASGRQLHTLLEQFGDEELSIIAENGTVVFHNGEIVSVTAMDKDTVSRLIRVLSELDDDPSFDGGVVLCRPDGAFISRNDEAFGAQCAPYYKKLTVVENLAPYVTDDVIKIAIFSFSNAEDTIVPRVTEYLGGMKLAVSGENWVDIMSPDANKGIALRNLASALNIPIERTLAFGDFLNDLELMQEAGTAYAMANAHPDIKAAADHLAPSNAEQGVITILRELMA